MTVTFLLWIATGLITGAGHACLLWKTSQPPFHHASAGLLRLLPVGAVLFAAAVGGGLIPVAAGWAVAFAVTVGIIAGRKMA